MKREREGDREGQKTESCFSLSLLYTFSRQAGVNTSAKITILRSPAFPPPPLPSTRHASLCFWLILLRCYDDGGRYHSAVDSLRNKNCSERPSAVVAEVLLQCAATASWWREAMGMNGTQARATNSKMNHPCLRTWQRSIPGGACW